MSAEVKPDSFQVTRKKLLLVAAAMALFIVGVIWPVFDACRLILADDPEAFGLRRGLNALGIAIAFSLYAYWHMAQLCLPGKPEQPPHHDHVRGSDHS